MRFKPHPGNPPTREARVGAFLAVPRPAGILPVMSSMRCRILGNSADRPLVSRVSDLLVGAQSARLAIGYLFIEGLAPLAVPLLTLASIQLLIGNVENRLTEEQLREESMGLPTAETAVDTGFAAPLRKERDRSVALTTLNLRRTINALPRTEATRSLLVGLAGAIAERRLQVRLCREGRLHAKGTLIGYPKGHKEHPGVAIVGTSNISLAPNPSAHKHSSDLDVLLTGSENFGEVNGWFDSHWSTAQDFQKELFEELGRSWPLNSSAI